MLPAPSSVSSSVSPLKPLTSVLPTPSDTTSRSVGSTSSARAVLRPNLKPCDSVSKCSVSPLCTAVTLVSTRLSPMIVSDGAAEQGEKSGDQQTKLEQFLHIGISSDLVLLGPRRAFFTARPRSIDAAAS